MHLEQNAQVIFQIEEVTLMTEKVWVGSTLRAHAKLQIHLLRSFMGRMVQVTPVKRVIYFLHPLNFFWD